MSTVDYIYENLGKANFTNESDGARPVLALRTNKRLLLVIDRETIGPFVNRSTDPSDTIRYRDPEGRQLVRVPSRKFKSKEKLRGLEICRAYGLVDSDYEYNNVTRNELLNNPNSILFGDTNVQGDAAGLPSKFIYGEGLSTDEVSVIAQPLTHNALSEEGTMWDRSKGSFRTSLFETLSILPGAHIIQTITVDSPTPESLVHLLNCLTATRYGAQTSVTGPNIRNKVIAILATREEPPVTAYTLNRDICLLSKNGEAERAPTIVDNVVKNAFDNVIGNKVLGDEAHAFVCNIRAATDLSELYATLRQQSEDFYRYVYEGKAEGKSKKKK